MIRLTTETKVDKDGNEVDNSFYLDGVDSNNLCIKRGTTIINYFGDVRTAFTRALNYCIKGSNEELTMQSIIDKVEELDNNIKEGLDESIRKQHHH